MGVRLKELRKEKGMSLTKLSEILEEKYGISASTSQLMYYEKGEREPRNKQFWKKLADYFGVSEAYLLGYSSVKTEADLKVSVLDEALEELRALEKLRIINNMLLVENDEGHDMWILGFRTAMVAIENFKKEIELEENNKHVHIRVPLFRLRGVLGNR